MLIRCVHLWLQAVTELLKLAPSTAVLLTRDENGHTTGEQEVPAALVQQGDLLKVRYMAASGPACKNVHTCY